MLCRGCFFSRRVASIALFLAIAYSQGRTLRPGSNCLAFSMQLQKRRLQHVLGETFILENWPQKNVELAIVSLHKISKRLIAALFTIRN